MLSAARQAANAANARSSTGPRTPEGKRHSAQNARKHGLTARDLIIREDEREEFHQLLASYAKELQPQGVLEQTVFNQLIHAAWNLARLRRLEAGLSTSAADPLLDDSLDATLTRLARFQARAERAFYRALREMRELQTNRALLAKHDPAARDQPVPALASVAELTKRTQPAAEPIEEMLAHLDREAELLLQSRCSSGLPAGHSGSRLLTSAAQ